jgi:hypothetical protein
MRTHEGNTSTARRRAGVIYVEELLVIVVSLCIAALLAAIALQLLQPRYARIATVLYSGVP